MAWASEQTTGSGVRKAVLLALANAANHHTGRCHPSVRRICEETEFGSTAVKNALAELTATGLIWRQRRRREDGSLGTYQYVFPSVVPADDLETADDPPETAGVPRPETAGVSLNQELLNQEGATPNGVAHTARVPTAWKAAGKRVTEDEAGRSAAILHEWNEQTGQRLGGRTWRAKIILRLREHPELTDDDHAAIIHATLADPWWKGVPSPSVVYGNDATFERSIENARTRGGAAGAYDVAARAIERARGAS